MRATPTAAFTYRPVSRSVGWVRQTPDQANSCDLILFHLRFGALIIFGISNPMPAFNPRSFTSPDRLKSISAKRLLAFFQIWDGYFRDRGLILPTAAADNFPFDELAGILLRPDESDRKSVV